MPTGLRYAALLKGDLTQTFFAADQGIRRIVYLLRHALNQAAAAATAAAPLEADAIEAGMWELYWKTFRLP